MLARHLITVACIVIAIVLYAADSKYGAALVLLGMAFESAFWYRVVRSRKQR